MPKKKIRGIPLPLGRGQKETSSHLYKGNAKKASGKTILMMLLVKGDNNRYHYMPNTNLDRLLNSKARHCNCIWQKRCLRPFCNSCKDAYEKHKEICCNMKRQVEKMSEFVVLQNLAQDHVSNSYNHGRLLKKRQKKISHLGKDQ